MLALVFRGIFLIGVLSWYSSSVWKMIDGYFKEKFQKYLHEEYERNPKMRADVDAYGAADKKAAPVLPTVENLDGLQKIIDFLDEPTCTVDLVNSKDTESRSGKDKTSCSSENEVVKSSIDKNAFLESTKNSTAMKNDESLSEGNAFTDRSTEKSRTTIDTAKTAKAEVSKSIDGAANNKQKSGESYEKKLSRIKMKLPRERKKKLKVKIITLTDADFESAKSKRSADDDFSEFDTDDSIVQEVPEGVLVSELPFKPKADIGDLERVSPEEYCPLTMGLEDELSCGETRKWP
ncbi:uncharacterized protein LOC107265067 [Cephus cinctus]|uniref:Uncharacterized protein LOC107265067 n=1 Tax=Cephus cinctus TaxID=211228 RepID=A0AAJ7BMT9_CEPCN|nr:uncharacterized protein LOC107265067 [Cephus cinctus]